MISIKYVIHLFIWQCVDAIDTVDSVSSQFNNPHCCFLTSRLYFSQSTHSWNNSLWTHVQYTSTLKHDSTRMSLNLFSFIFPKQRNRKTSNSFPGPDAPPIGYLIQEHCYPDCMGRWWMQHRWKREAVRLLQEHGYHDGTNGCSSSGDQGCSTRRCTSLSKLISHDHVARCWEALCILSKKQGCDNNCHDHKWFHHGASSIFKFP